jgi:hypothetical protein
MFSDCRFEAGREAALPPFFASFLGGANNLPEVLCDCPVPVAQPDRASDFGSEGWGFESLQARNFRRALRRYLFFEITRASP